MDKLLALAEKKASEYAERQESVAVAIIGSVARGDTWEGSDIDLWVFAEGRERFEDGLVDDVYWEADIHPASDLDCTLDDKSWLKPPSLNEDAARLTEVLWGCKVMLDTENKLTSLKEAIDSRVANQELMNRRVMMYLEYGGVCLTGLEFAEPVYAIVNARAVATDYGIASYWMKQGQLLSSMMRVPERLESMPEIQRLYREVFSLRGKAGAEEFLRRAENLPSQVYEHIKRDLELEFDMRSPDGSVRHFRQMMAAGGFNLEDILPVLGLEDDLEAQKARVLEQTRQILDLVSQL
jgi:hypothetical protein